MGRRAARASSPASTTATASSAAAATAAITSSTPSLPRSPPLPAAFTIPRRPLDVPQLQLQEQVTAIYSYYGLPVVSVRDGLLPSLRSGELSPMDWVNWGDFGFHPPPSLQAFVAGALLEAIRRQAAYYSAEDAAAAPAEATARATATATATAASAIGGAAVGAIGGASPPQLLSGARPWQLQRLPPPMHRGLPVRFPLACYVWGINYRLNFKHYGYRMLAPPPTLSSLGWSQTLEQRTSRAGGVRINPGLRADASGATLVLQLDTSSAGEALGAALVVGGRRRRR